MKYAIFSDIHGNIHALKAALSDAEAQGTDKYIFLGDYTNGFPWGDEVTKKIREMESATVISGNGEGYLIDLHEKPQGEWLCEQFKPIYWAYRSLSNENMEFLLNLPETADICDSNDEIHLVHSSNIFYRSQKIEPFRPERLRIMMQAPFSRQEYLEVARNAIISRSDALADIHELPKGIYLFGHNHLQFHMECDGRLFINPGSCGEALDWDTTAAYTLLERGDERWIVTERRVEYDLKAVVEGLHTSGYAEYAPMWSEVMKVELLTGRDYFTPFVLHLVETGRRLERNEYPVSNEVWDAAVQTWDMNK